MSHMYVNLRIVPNLLLFFDLLIILGNCTKNKPDRKIHVQS